MDTDNYMSTIPSPHGRSPSIDPSTALLLSDNELQLLPSLFANQSPLGASKEDKTDDFSLEPQVKKQKPVVQRKFEETQEENKSRFLMELEFVQCLANPAYLHCRFLHCDY